MRERNGRAWKEVRARWVLSFLWAPPLVSSSGFSVVLLLEETRRQLPLFLPLSHRRSGSFITLDSC